MAGGGELLNKSFFEILDSQLFNFYKYYHVLFKIGLKPNEVHTLSIILSFNKAGKDYLGSCGFLAKELNITSRTALNTLTSLTNKGFIKKQVSKGGNVSIYSINEHLLKCIFLNNIKSPNLVTLNSVENPQIPCKNSTVKQCQNGTVNSNKSLQLKNQNYEKNSQLNNNDNEVNYEKNSQIPCKNFIVNYEKISHNKNIYKNNNKNIYAHSKNEYEKTKSKIKSKHSKEELENKFNQFWDKYPKKVSKKNAKKVFLKLNPSNEQLEKIYKALENQKKSKQWQDKQYIPYPATWLNGERWEDETDTTAKQNNITDIHKDEDIKYMPMPESLM